MANATKHANELWLPQSVRVKSFVQKNDSSSFTSYINRSIVQYLFQDPWKHINDKNLNVLKSILDIIKKINYQFLCMKDITQILPQTAWSTTNHSLHHSQKSITFYRALHASNNTGLSKQRIRLALRWKTIFLTLKPSLLMAKTMYVHLYMP